MRAYDATRLYFDRAADRMDLSENMRRLLLTAKREVTVQIAVGGVQIARGVLSSARRVRSADCGPL